MFNYHDLPSTQHQPIIMNLGDQAKQTVDTKRGNSPTLTSKTSWETAHQASPASPASQKAAGGEPFNKSNQVSRVRTLQSPMGRQTRRTVNKLNDHNIPTSTRKQNF